MEWALLAQFVSAAQNAVSSYYEAKSQQFLLRSQAIAAEFEGSMADLNSRQAELDAQAVLRSGQERAGLRGMQLAQDIGTTKVAQAGAGVDLGVGSAAEIRASERLAAQIDTMRIGIDAAREAGARRMAAAEWQNRAGAARLQARQQERAARMINPWMRVGLSLVNSSGSLAAAWAQGQEQAAYGPRAARASYGSGRGQY